MSDLFSPDRDPAPDLPDRPALSGVNAYLACWAVLILVAVAAPYALSDAQDPNHAGFSTSPRGGLQILLLLAGRAVGVPAFLAGVVCLMVSARHGRRPSTSDGCLAFVVAMVVVLGVAAVFVR